jgi:FKBP-type peptidyl-prolyl cis-trans isomerase
MIKTFNLLILALVAKAQNEFKVTVTQQGEGDFPTKGSKITAHYTGTLLDGTVFDSSVTRGKPFNFVLGEGRVIKCWDEGFAQLNKGSKAVLNCPPDMAYGDRGAGALIKAGATLQFEVELLDFTIPAATPKKLAFRVEKLNEGTGPTVPKGVNASVHYTGTLLDGTVFDSSVPRG